MSTVPSAPARSVVVAGDVMIDWNLIVEHDIAIGSRSWREAGKVKQLKQLGGAWLLADLVKKFAAKTSEPWSIHGIQAPLESDEYKIHQTYTVLSRAADEVWRVENFIGVRSVGDGGLRLEVDDRNAEIVVLLDSDLGFDTKGDADWPAAIKDPGHKPWIIFKTSVPAFEGLLWQHLIKHHGEKLIVVMSVDDLRRREIQLLRQLSWERAAQDIVNEMRKNPSLRALNACQYTIVSFGTAGAMLFPRDGKPQLIFDPAVMEGEWETHRKGGGIMIGYTSVLAASVTHEVLLQPEAPQLADAVARGIAGMRALFDGGFGKGTPVVSIDHIVEAAVKPDAAMIVSAATIVDADASTWTVLKDRIQASAAISPDNDGGDALYELAARAAVFGPEMALADVPQLRIRNLFSADREEIESLRSIKGLLQEYVKRKPSKPFSIAVFGSPGSGKSFGVEEIARHVGGEKITLLTFNLTQFAHSEDLHGAFHQVRDVSLRGKIPVVFWDEFDTTYGEQALGWLRYFIGPMQDGLFQEDQITHPIGTSVFVFAGGTATTVQEFVTPGDIDEVEWKALKVPDFISRLKGFLDVTGPNVRTANPDPHFLVRRAILLRSLLEKHCPDLFHEQGAMKILQIDPRVLHAFLNTARYRHGARSLESVIAMSTLAGRKRFDSSSLPPESQLGLHVELPFGCFGEEFKFTHDVVLLEQLARIAHETFCQAKKDKGWTYAPRRNEQEKQHDLLKDYAELREGDKERNRITVRWIPKKVEQEGYRMASAGSGEPRTLSDDEIRRLARLEHDLWMKGKKAQGYEYGPKPTESPKRNPYLIPWEELKPESQYVDEQMIRAIPKILNKARSILVKDQNVPPAPSVPLPR